ncbi:MAG: hypothetical protein M0Z41_11660 [Peptococcaceae bacterium]|nr:hypothetical protein [Peptococcaceae bacterium]
MTTTASRPGLGPSDPNPGEPFVSKGRSDLAAGWRVLYGRDRDDEEEAEPALPALAEEQTVALAGLEIAEKQTRPQKRFT